MVCVGRQASASELRVNFGTARYGVVVGLEHHAGSALSHDKTVAVFVKWAGGRGGIFVSGR